MKIVKRNGVFYLDFYFRGRRVREKVGSTKGVAIRAQAAREGEILQGRFKIVPKRGAPRFDDHADKYWELVSVHKRGAHVERYIIKTLKAHFGKYRVSDLTAEDAEKYKAVRSALVKPATVNRELTLVKHVLTKAAEWGVIADNPFRGVRNLEVQKQVERVLGSDEEIKLLDACDRVRAQQLRPVVVLALNTGMRRGELLSLDWARVDLNRRTVRITNAKSDAGNRTIPMNATVHLLLSELSKAATSPFVFPSNRKPGKRFLDLKKASEGP